MIDMNIERSVKVYKSLADETRLSIVRKLAEVGHEVDSSEIVIDCSLALKLSQPTMSHHFAKLVASGVLRERKSGTKKYYTLNRALLTAVGVDIEKN